MDDDLVMAKSCEEPIMAHDTTDQSEVVSGEVKLSTPVFGTAKADCDEPIDQSLEPKKTSLAQPECVLVSTCEVECCSELVQIQLNVTAVLV